LTRIANRPTLRLIQIRDDPGEDSAADRTVRLKAIQVIEGNEGKGGVVVNVNQQTNVAAIQPGYVIRLPALKPDRDAPPMIEGTCRPNADGD
jgi:hypothetical protein